MLVAARKQPGRMSLKRRMILKDRLALVILAAALGQPAVPCKAGALTTNPAKMVLAGATFAEARAGAGKRLRVAEMAAPRRASGLSPGAESGGPAINRTADFDRSDPRLAGITLRCGKDGAELVIIVVEPFPPRAQPKITLRAAEQEFYFAGSVIPTGAGVRLPVDGMKLATAPWLKSEEVAIRISEGDSSIEGVVPLAGLAGKVELFSVACARM